MYGGRRVHAELTLGRGVAVGHCQVELLMQRAGLHGVTGRPKWKRIKPDNISTDGVNRDIARALPNQLWATDITEHQPRKARSTAASRWDTCSRRLWAVPSTHPPAPHWSPTPSDGRHLLRSSRINYARLTSQCCVDRLNSPSPGHGPSPTAPRTPAWCPRPERRYGVNGSHPATLATPGL
ncbi:IS3 family transposase [Actinopolymorpha singaporensis]